MPPLLFSLRIDLLLLVSLLLVRRDARNDRRRAVTPARDGAESPDEEGLPVRGDSSSLDTDFAGCVSGDHEQRKIVLGIQRALSLSLSAGTNERTARRHTHPPTHPPRDS